MPNACNNSLWHTLQMLSFSSDFMLEKIVCGFALKNNARPHKNNQYSDTWYLVDLVFGINRYPVIYQQFSGNAVAFTFAARECAVVDDAFAA